jgi:hypothetical protein
VFRRVRLACAGALVIASMGLGGAPATAVQDAVPPPNSRALPSEIPAAWPPEVTGTRIDSIAEVGDQIVIAGPLTALGGLPRSRVAAFDKTTGAVSTAFAPTVTGTIYSVLPGPQPNTVYVAGFLRNVGGVATSRVALLDLTTGLPVPTFRPPDIDLAVNDLQRRGDRLYLAGDFTTIGGQPRGGLASLDATTGALTDFLAVSLTEHHNTNPLGAQKSIGAKQFDVTSDGSQMVVIGNFRKADGLDRDQVVQIDLSGATAVVRPDWQTNRFTPLCANFKVDMYVRGVSYSPDDSFFVVGANGGKFEGTLCDTASRWETHATGLDLQPTWIASTGGDTVWAITITEAAVFIGGHMRWLNNILGRDVPQSGAVPRAGVAAVDAANGIPLNWNPGRRPRGTAVFCFLPTAAGLWMGTDTDYVGPNREYYRPKLAFFPYAGGRSYDVTTTPQLPGTLYVGQAPVPPTSEVLFRVNAGGPAVPALDGGPTWQADTATTSPYRTSGSIASAPGFLIPTTESVPPTAPVAVFGTERYDVSGGVDLQWNLPIPAGTPISVRLYFANGSGSTALVGQRVFDVSLEGGVVLNDFDIVAATGHRRGIMRSFDLVSDGNVDLDFGRVVGNPLINAIEIVRRPAPSAPGTLTGTPMTPTTVGSTSAVPSSIDWAAVRGAFTVGGTLFLGTAEGMLSRATFDGRTIGTPVNIEPYHDPVWMNLPNGKPAGTFDGMHPSFYGQIPHVSGMFYSGSRLYYSRWGVAGLSSVAFSPDSGIVHGVPEAAPTALSFADVGGMFLSGDQLYFVVASTGDLRRTTWSGASTSGPGVLISGPGLDGRDWRGTAHFLGTPVATPAGTGFVTATATDDAYVQDKSVTVPSSVRAGDTLLLGFTGEAAMMPPTPNGWTLVRTQDNGTSVAVGVWTRQATSADAGATITLTQPAKRRALVSLSAYRGFSAVALSAASTDTDSAVHATPTLPVLTGDLVVAVFADRGTATTAWTAGGGQVGRLTAVGTTTTHVSTFISDSNFRVPGGSYPGAQATTNAASARGISVGLVLRP